MMSDFTKICFIVMPFGKKEVIFKYSKKILFFTIPLSKKIIIDFNDIYDNIFKPAISRVDLPEGGKLIPKRTDDDFFSADIGKEMFEYLEYSRMVFADITGLNANVFYELGIRHRARSNGTIIFRVNDAPIPFDINKIRAFPYEYEPVENIERSKETIVKVISETLKNNKIDSPVRIALQEQQGNPELELLLIDAENAIRNNDLGIALNKYQQALSLKDNITSRMKLGIIYKELGEWEKALIQFKHVNMHSRNYSDAYKERGIAENKLYEQDSARYPDNGEESLKKAIHLNSFDFDAYSSLGGILKRLDRFEESLENYQKAIDISNGHPYPLLNAIKLQSKIDNRIELTQPTKVYLHKAKNFLESQTRNNPPFNSPWSFFDLAEVYMFLEDNKSGFIENVKNGIIHSKHEWMLKTFLTSLQLIEDVKTKPYYFDDGIKLLKNALNKNSNRMYYLITYLRSNYDHYS
jgi:tetratricopeptide (TPR) repeat protein